ncbi:MAG: helix-turn-helix transcriptional regulator [Alcanivorax sp.]|uniref:Helix-turn-helix transcriptional regulator n=1 Tax=Alloalcanivorax marinus TaxID=1177169 RepID=A0A9Q3UNR2_9GAMM|nr:helix-turn-helix transcriptional regulator [Alloalcanivorax marinus]MBM7332066.1 helix-turn-helix transcriptional regulator [Alloalcanivorax marinus]MCC4309790.1 helix-turn-helix transcriptional regulator [Alloalcanivorax marinus]
MEASNVLPYRGAAYEGLLDTLYATPTDPQCWPAFLEQLVGVSRSRSARLLVMDTAARKVISSAKVNIDDGAHRNYVDYFVNACPWRPELQDKPGGRLYSTYLDFSCRQKRFYGTEFYNDWARQLDIHHGVCGTVHQDQDHTIQLLVQRTGGQGPYTQPDTAWFNHLVPHVRRAIELNRHGQRLRWQRTAASVTGCRPYAVVGARGRVEYLCERARILVANEPQLLHHNGRLTPRPPRLRDHYRRLLHGVLAGAGRGWGHAGGALAIPRPGQRPLVCVVSPLAPEVARALLPDGGRALIYFHLPEQEGRVDESQLAALFDLTPAEARVARGVAEGLDLDALARARGVSVQTVRAQLKAVFRKTGTSRQNELAARILKSPALRPAEAAPITLPHGGP